MKTKVKTARRKERREQTRIVAGTVAPAHERVPTLYDASSPTYTPVTSISTLENWTGLDTMPGDILVLIAQNLPLSSEACLIFTCKQIFYRLGPWARLSLQIKLDDKKAERWQYLDFISRGCPGYVPCYSCNALHKRNDAISSTNCTKQAGCLFAMRSTGMFWFGYVRLSMRAAWFGPEYGLSLEELSTAFSTAERHPLSEKLKFAVSNDFRIVRDRLLMETSFKKIIKLAVWKLNNTKPLWRFYLD